MNNPHSLECGTFTIDIDDFDASCCTQTEHNFDIFDSFRSGDDDKNISTKIINHGFDLNITSQEDFNGSICLRIESDQKSSDWVKEDFNKTKIITISDSNVSFITKKADIFLKYKSDTNSSDINCSDALDGNSNSQDYFAIRADHFEINAPSPLYAGEDFNISFFAKVSENGANTKEYNESLNGTFEVNATEIKNECITGNFNLSDFNFSDGVAENIDANYSEVGELNITIHEKSKCEDRFASVDCDDENVTDYWNTNANLSITPKSKTIIIQPYELNITEVNISASTGEDWLYMADVNDMNLTLFASLQASNKQHQKLEDFNASCYAQDVNVTLHLTTLDANGSLGMNYSAIDGVILNSGNTLADINKTITIKKDSFIKGEGNASYALNVDRNFSIPINPFKVGELNVTIEEGDAKELNNKEDNNQSFIFYYARVRANDITTQKTSVPHFAEIEVYDASGSSYVSEFHQNTLKWYKNTRHNNLLSDIIEINGTKSSTLNNATINISEFTTINGKVDFNISKKDIGGSYYMHIKTHKWLWYIPSTYGNDYNDAKDSHCTTHPCFNYTLKKDGNGSGIESGSFNGTDYTLPSRGEYKKTGIKVFR